MPGLRQREYLCLRARLVGISTDKYSRPLSFPMDGMMRRPCWFQHPGEHCQGRALPVDALTTHYSSPEK